ncbi:hypothetical protein HaLaN_11847 [Haematococcus lacustris]|uniref:Uncharacterized protein n=1 Tax=Haematococcus lacustris TaxID=44745 RepID=A0A699Z234_HAELA|nr:hypothetical protein HaLaN_11847 [Haematococcus lacustris]
MCKPQGNWQTPLRFNVVAPSLGCVREGFAARLGYWLARLEAQGGAPRTQNKINKEPAWSLQGMTWSNSVSGQPLHMSGPQCPA